MTRNGRTKLGRKREVAIAALLSESTHEDAAKKAGISTATLSRWLRDTAFARAYRRAQRAVRDGAIRQVTRLADKAVAALEKNLTCGTPSVEVQAARATLAEIRAANELDVEDRLDELERRIKGRGEGQTCAASNDD